MPWVRASCGWRQLPLLIGFMTMLGPGPAWSRVVLLGIDGGSWNLIDAAIARGELPHLSALAKRGVTAELETVEPLISPTVWSSIATGRSPESHGVTDFRQTRAALRVPTVFERLAMQGVRVGLYDYLLTWPPPPLPDGFVIPGWLRRDDRVYPPDVFDRSGLSAYAYSTRDIRSADAILANALREIAEKPGRFVRLVESWDPQVAAVTFYALDAVSHRFWNAAFPEAFPDAPGRATPAQRGAIHEVLRRLDGAVGEIAASLAADDVLLIVSDHGFRADPDGVQRKWSLTFDSLMQPAGLDPERDGFAIATQWRRLAVQIEAGDYASREGVLARWVELADSLRDEQGHRLVRTKIARTVFSDSTLDRLIQQAEEALWGASRKWHVRDAHAVVVIDPELEDIERIWPDGLVRSGSQRARAGDLFQLAEFSGDHAPIGIFLAAGGPIAPRAERGRLSVLEIAPLVAYLAGTAVPDDLEAAVPVRLLAREFLAARPVRSVAAASLPSLETSFSGTAAEGDLEERLRSLGYAD